MEELCPYICSRNKELFLRIHTVSCIMMKRRAFKLIQIMALTISISGCYFVSFEDVSALPDYSQYVGQIYKSESKTTVCRISFDQNYKPEPSHYIVVSRPNCSGPEVISYAELPIGTTFKVLKVLRCTNCFLDFEERVKLMVQLISTDSFNDRDVEVNAKLIGSAFVLVNPKQLTISSTLTGAKDAPAS